MSSFPISAELWALAEVALGYALQRARDSKGHAFEPVMVTESVDGERTLIQTALLAPVDPLEFVKEALKDKSDVRRAAFALDGNVDLGGTPEDAVVLLAGDRGAPGHRFAQRYRRKSFGRFETVGNLGYFGEEPSIFE